MWIIPSNLPASLAYVPEYVASNEELSAHWDTLSESPLLWKSKPLSSKTFLQAWKRVWWVQHLFGRILKPFHTQLFTESYTASLADTHANHSAWQDSKKEQPTLDTFGRILSALSNQLDLFGASLKTSLVTSQLGTTSFMRAYETWVTRSRLEYTARAKRAHHTNANASLSSLSTPDTWSTPRVGGQEDYETRLARGKDMGLQGQVKYLTNWPSPTVSTGDYQNQQDGSIILKLQGAVKWPSPDTGTRGARVNQNGHQITLQDAVKKTLWKTPTTNETAHPNSEIDHTGRRKATTEGGTSHSLGLADQVGIVEVRNWGTPNTMDYLPQRSKEAANKMANGQRKGRSNPSNLREQIDPLMLQAYQDAKLPTTNYELPFQTPEIEDHYQPTNWPTPDCSDRRSANSTQQGLSNVVKVNWPTPVHSEVRQGFQNRNNGKKGTQESLSTIVITTHNPQPKTHNQDGQLHLDNPNTHGNTHAHSDIQNAYQKLYEACGLPAGRILRKCWEKKYGKKLHTISKQSLNPFWVLQLMGTTSEKTFFVPLAMEWWNKQPK